MVALMENYKDLMTFNEVRELLSVSRATLYKYIANGKIKALKIADSSNSPFRIYKASVIAYLQKCEDDN